AAYRIFLAYKDENPTSPELAQMYLDLVRLFLAEKDATRAEQTLSEFETRYRDARQFPQVALKLADCYIESDDYQKERALYQRLLDYLGKNRQPGAALM